MVAMPLLVDDEVIYSMPSTPLTASSRGVTTLFITASALAPVYSVLMVTTGGATSGNCSTGRLR